MPRKSVLVLVKVACLSLQAELEGGVVQLCVRVTSLAESLEPKSPPGSMGAVVRGLPLVVSSGLVILKVYKSRLGLKVSSSLVPSYLMCFSNSLGS